MSGMRLVQPARAQLAGYTAALRRGWSADNLRPAAAQEELQRIAADADLFLAQQHDPQAKGPPVTLPDGSRVPRIPGLRLWMWNEGGDADADADATAAAAAATNSAAGSAASGSDADARERGFIGSIGLRWGAGGAPLPPHVLGHIGYAVVPWRQRRGHATRALGLLLPVARAQGLTAVELTTDPDNAASQRVIAANGGVLVEAFNKGAAYNNKPGLRFRIALV